MKILKACKVGVMLCCLSTAGMGMMMNVAEAAFVHSGIFYTNEDFAKAKAHLAKGEQPWKQAWEISKSNKWADPQYVAHPVAAPSRSARTEERVGDAEMFDDSFAALHHAIIYRVSNDPKEVENSRQKAEEILNAWADTVNRGVSGGEPQLLAGLCGYKFAAAADIMRNDAKWVEDGHLAKVQNMLKQYFVPICQQFLETHFRLDNGLGYPYYYRGNQDLAAIITIMSTGILSDDDVLYEEAIYELKKGHHNGRIDNYIFPTSDPNLAQGEESGRDQGHGQLGIGLLASMAQASYVQHMANPEIENLFEYNDRIIMKAAEYAAKYNLGYDGLPFTPLYMASNNNYDPKGVRIEDKISPKFRSEMRPIYDLIWYYYHGVDKFAGDKEGTPLYYTKQAIDKSPVRNHTDHLPFSMVTSTSEVIDYSNQNYCVSFVVRGNTYNYWTTQEGSNVVVGTKLLSLPEKATKNEKFYMKYAGNGAYTIKQASSGKYVVASSSSDALHIEEALETDDACKFTVQDCGNGYVNIKSIKTGQFVRVDISTGKMYADQNNLSGDIVNRFRVLTQAQ